MTRAVQRDLTAALAADGYALLPGCLARDEIAAVIAAWETVCRRNPDDLAILADAGGRVTGARNLLRMWPEVVDLARRPPLLRVLEALLGPTGGVVRGLFFDKPPGAGWALPWHKDYNIAVRKHGPVGRFTKPTTKAGVPHVEAPAELLRQMVTVRIHLDDMTDENGPLRVIPGSHESALTRDDPGRLPVVVHCRAGDVFLMRPLLTHASAHPGAETVCHRRIVHLECAPTSALPDGYEWHDFVPYRDRLCGSGGS
jgi:hypothetical protein